MVALSYRFLQLKHFDCFLSAAMRKGNETKGKCDNTGHGQGRLRVPLETGRRQSA